MKETIKILNKTYELKFVKEVSSSQDLQGMIRLDKQVIYIDENLHVEAQWQTLLHEIVHGILHGLNYTDLRDDEKFVDNLAVALAGIIKVDGLNISRKE